MASLPSIFPLAIHISDGFLTPWGWGTAWGFAIALIAFGAWRVRDEMIPRIALLTSAFFVTSLIHVPVPGGPRTHLLLNGLLGILLGRHAPLAIFLGLFLQVALFGHGGYTTLGANVVILSIPALLTWGLFTQAAKLPRLGREELRLVLVFASAMLFCVSLVFTIAVLCTVPWTEVRHLDLSRATWITLHPAMLLLASLISGLACWAERRLDNGPLFPVGLFLGELAVLLTVALNGLALLLVGVADWHTMVFLTCVLHLPLAVIEGTVVGFTLGFLARVKPELIANWQPPKEETPPEVAPLAPTPAPVSCTPPILLMALLGLLVFSNSARAHRLHAEHRVDLAAKKITIESWYSSGDTPKNAKLRVVRPDGSLLIEGEPDANGKFVFTYEVAEDLNVTVSAPGGHGSKFVIPASALGGNSGSGEHDPSGPNLPTRGAFGTGDVVAGLAFLLALSAFVLSYRNAKAIKELQEAQNEPLPSEPSEGSPSTMIKPEELGTGDETIRIVPDKKD